MTNPKNTQMKTYSWTPMGLIARYVERMLNPEAEAAQNA